MDSGSGLIFTNEKCVGCNKCINVCSAIGACISKEENGRARIEVDGTKCVACGSCIDVCVHGAREFLDDTARFFEDLKNGEPISLLLAPAFKANYPDEYESQRCCEHSPLAFYSRRRELYDRHRHQLEVRTA